MRRAVSPVLGTLLLTALTLLLATVAGLAAVGTVSTPDPATPVVLSASVDAEDGRIVLVHESGPPIDVREIAVRIFVDGEPLAHQPPVPFFSATGFHSGPTGPFNPSADPEWAVSERASLEVASTNAPEIAQGVRVRIEIYEGSLPIARVETTAQ